jgi:hypothetical protein
VVTRVVRWTRRHVVVQARVYRQAGERRPAATAFGVWYRDFPTAAGRDPVADGVLEAVETLAVERALALLDVDGEAAAEAAPSRAEPPSAPALRRVGAVPRRVLPPAVADLLALVARGAAGGIRPERAARWRRALLDASASDAGFAVDPRLGRWERRLRARLARGACPGGVSGGGVSLMRIRAHFASPAPLP